MFIRREFTNLAGEQLTPAENQLPLSALETLQGNMNWELRNGRKLKVTKLSDEVVIFELEACENLGQRERVFTYTPATDRADSQPAFAQFLSHAASFIRANREVFAISAEAAAFLARSR